MCACSCFSEKYSMSSDCVPREFLKF
jgi:hypothetical protein